MSSVVCQALTSFFNIISNGTISKEKFLTSWNETLLEKLTGSQLVKKFPAFFGTQKFIAAITRARHLSLTRAISI
jgi:hypothetical protein